MSHFVVARTKLSLSGEGTCFTPPPYFAGVAQW